MVKLSDWQLWKLRDALSNYRWDQQETWVYVHAAIINFTGVSIGTSQKAGAEILRKFVEGVNVKGKRDRVYQVPQPDSLRAIIDFLCHEDIDYLSEEELRGYAPGIQAPQRLLEYLQQNIGKKHLIPPRTLLGEFEAELADDKYYIVRQMSLHRAADKGLIQVTELENYYDLEEAEAYDEWDSDERLEKIIRQEEYGGWAILTPEHNMLFFLKEAKQGTNRCYFTLASDFSPKKKPALTQFILMNHDYPLEINPETPREDFEHVKDDALVSLMDKMAYFSRIEV